MKHVPVFFLALACALAACTRQELPEPEVQSPVFRAAGTIGGETFSLEAGVNGVALQSFFSQNAFGVYEYTGGFVQEGCDSCDGLLTIRFLDDQVVPVGNPPSVESVLYPGEFPLATGEITAVQPLSLLFQADEYPGAVYTWNFGGGNTASGSSVMHTFPSPGLYNVLLEVSRSGHTSMLNQQVAVGFGEPCGRRIQAEYLGNRTWRFTREGDDPGWGGGGWGGGGWGGGGWGGGDDDEGFWQVDGFPAGDDDELVFTFPGPDSAEHTVCLWYPDGPPGCPPVICRKVSAVANALPCLANFDQSPAPDPQALGRVRITYLRSDGQLFTSAIPQNGGPDASFTVLESEPYGSELNGHPTRKLRIAFDALLEAAGPSEEVIEASDVEVVMAFTYPE